MPDDSDTSVFTFTRRGVLFILSAPSGAGKTTLSQRILKRLPNLYISISYTTRNPRAGEEDGHDYHFVDEARFHQLCEAGAFAEWAQVHGSLYGTPRSPLDEALACGQDCLLDIDVQGARQVKEMYPEAVSIFVLPPSWQELATRLRSRGTETDEVIARRLQRAQEETSALGTYDYVLVNEHLDHAVRLLDAIIQAERARVSRHTNSSSPLLAQALRTQSGTGAQ